MGTEAEDTIVAIEVPLPVHDVQVQMCSTRLSGFFQLDPGLKPKGDTMADPREYVGYYSSDYLEGLAQMTAHIKQRTYELMNIEPGHRVLDIGCGPGTDTLSLSQLVGPSGNVVGVDYDEEMVDEANHRAVREHIDRWVTHTKADATSLPFEDGYFDSCRSDRVLQHLNDPEQALSEMIRVTKSGGSVVNADTDHATLSIDTTETDIERRLMQLRVEKMFNNACSGRQLYRQSKNRGLTDIRVEAFGIPNLDYDSIREAAAFDRMEALAIETGTITDRELEIWRNSLKKAGEDGVLFASATMIVVAGRKPQS